MSKIFAASRTPSSPSNLAISSGPIPAGSPGTIAMRGLVIIFVPSNLSLRVFCSFYKVLILAILVYVLCKCVRIAKPVETASRLIIAVVI